MTAEKTIEGERKDQLTLKTKLNGKMLVRLQNGESSF